MGRVRKGQGQDCPRPFIGQRQASQSAEAGKQYAFRQHLTHQPATRRAQRHANRSLCFARRAPCQQQVGNVCTSDQQHQRGDGHQQIESLAGLLLQVLNARTPGCDHDVLARDDRRTAIAGIGILIRQPQSQAVGHLSLQSSYAHTRLHSTNHVEPIAVENVEKRIAPINDRFDSQRHPDGRRAATNAVTKESRAAQCQPRSPAGLGYTVWNQPRQDRHRIPIAIPDSSSPRPERRRQCHLPASTAAPQTA